MGNQRTKFAIFCPLIMLIFLFLISPVQAAHNESSGLTGTLPPFQPPGIIDGSGRKILVIYMVGSDLESDGGAATSDLIELIDGYNTIAQDHVEAIVALGGADKFGWQGMKFTDISQIIEDASDGQFGNGDSYLYRADSANIDDKSSLSLFLEYVTQRYENFDSSFLTFWNHGGAYTGFGNDEVFNYGSLSLSDIDNALTESNIDQFDLIGFDACPMGSMEVARFITPHAKYLLASEDLEPGHGWHSEAMIYGSTHTSEFGRQSREDQRVSIDLKNFAQTIRSQIPEFQATFDILRKNDTTSPEVVDLNGDANSDDFNWDDLYDQEALKNSNALAEQNDPLKKVERNDHLPRFLSGERAAFVNNAHDPAMRKSSATSGIRGVSAKFSDPNLAKVTTIFGFEFSPYENEPDNRFFMSVAEVQAYSTTNPGVYFTPQWNKEWYCVAYNPDPEITQWMPLIFQGSYTKEEKRYTKYSAEIDYVESGKDYSGCDYPADRATLKIIVDEDNEVVSHHVQTYRIIYTGEDDSMKKIVFDKKTKTISKGDKIQFWTSGFSMDERSEDTWFKTGDMITFTQAPVFTVEELEFEDEQGTPLEYKYAMWAEDISNNGTLTTPFAAGSPDDDPDHHDHHKDDDHDSFIFISCFISTIAGSTGSAE